jgi:mono/diheme cytochrome c family protein
VSQPRPDSGPPAPAADDLPCDIAETIAAHCTVCHGDPLTGGARMRLLSHADLTDPSYADPAATFAQRAVIRMRSDAMPMPPAGPRAPEERIAAFEAWVAAGAPPGACGVVDPFDTPVQCSSGETWPADADEGPRMHPGGACITCHAMQDGAPDLWLGGTVYPTAHEPIDCLGADTGGAAVVEITDAAGRVFMLTPNESGNFLLDSEDEDDYVAPFSPVFEYPYRARVLFEGRERAMATPQTTGDCNSCHTVDGANGAPGRIVLP